MGGHGPRVTVRFSKRHAAHAGEQLQQESRSLISVSVFNGCGVLCCAVLCCAVLCCGEQEKCDEFAHEVMRLVPQEADRDFLIDMLVRGGRGARGGGAGRDVTAVLYCAVLYIYAMVFDGTVVADMMRCVMCNRCGALIGLGIHGVHQPGTESRDSAEPPRAA